MVTSLGFCEKLHHQYQEFDTNIKCQSLTSHSCVLKMLKTCILFRHRYIKMVIITPQTLIQMKHKKSSNNKKIRIRTIWTNSKLFFDHLRFISGVKFDVNRTQEVMQWQNMTVDAIRAISKQFTVTSGYHQNFVETLKIQKF